MLYRFAFLVAVVLAIVAFWTMKGSDKKSEGPRIFIVGGGLTGLSAAIEAQRAGARVVLLEQEAQCGGNSAKASSGINGAATAHQKKQNIIDSVDLFRSDTIKSGRGQDQKELVDLLVEHSAEAITFLEKEAKLDMSVISLLGGHKAARTHRAKITGKPVNVGLAITSAMEAAVRKLGIEVRLNSIVTGLIQDDVGAVVGLRVRGPEGGAEEHLMGRVVLATGGYSSDRDGLLKEFNSKYVDFPSTNALWRTHGEGVKMGRAVGATLNLMSHVQIHPTGLVDPKDPSAKNVILAGEALRGNGGLLINYEGKRFVNELDYRDVVSEAILRHGSRIQLPEWGRSPVAAFLVLNDAAVSKFKEAIQFYSFKGLVTKYANLQEFCTAQNIDLQEMTYTFSSYNDDAAKGGVPDRFGKSVFASAPFLPDQALTVMIVTPSVHYTMGGLVIDASTRVLGKLGPIPGLYAAGEVTGGLHGSNRLGGNSLLECVVFGRIAGKEAAKVE